MSKKLTYEESEAKIAEISEKVSKLNNRKKVIQTAAGNNNYVNKQDGLAKMFNDLNDKIAVHSAEILKLQIGEDEYDATMKEINKLPEDKPKMDVA